MVTKSVKEKQGKRNIQKDLHGQNKKVKVEEQSESDEYLSQEAPSEDGSMDELSEEDNGIDQGNESEVDELDDLEDTEKEGISQEQDSEEEDDLEAPKDGKKSALKENLKSSKELHEEQRKLLGERKRHRKAGYEIQRIKVLWEKLRNKKQGLPKSARDHLCDEIWSLCKDIIFDLVMKHDASRVVQTLVKYCSRERRDVIVQSLKGQYYRLATSSYGKYLLVKLLHYGSKESRSLIIDELHGSYRKLMKHKEGAYVVEDIYVLYASAEKKKQIIREFWGSEYAIFKESGKDKSVTQVIRELSEKKRLIMKNLYGTIAASIEKGSSGFQILHAAMQSYTAILKDDIDRNDSEIREFIELLSEQVAELVHTPEGSDVACSLVALANAKERKVIIRSIKSFLKELEMNEYGYIVLTSLLMTVDDTVLLQKSLISSLVTSETITELVCNKYSRRPLLYIISGLDGKFFNPATRGQLLEYEKIAYAKTSKKGQEQRRSELLMNSLPLFYESIVATTKADNDDKRFNEILLSNIASQFLSTLILTKTDNQEINNKFRKQILDAIFNLAVKGDVLEDHHLINKVPFTSRLLKSLIQGNDFRFNPQSKKVEKIPDNSDSIPGTGSDFALKIVDEIFKNDQLNAWVQQQGAFVLVSCLEVLELTDSKRFNKLRNALKSIREEFPEGNKGAEILLDHIK